MKKLVNFIKFLAIIFFMFQSFVGTSYAANYSYTVEDIVLDNSDRIVFIKGSGTITKTIKAFDITNPLRYVIDIEDSIIKTPKKTYKIQNSSYIENISIAQFNNNPNTVRIVFNLKSGCNPKAFKTYTNNKSITVKYQNSIIDNSIQYKFYTPDGDQDKSAKLQNTGAIMTLENEKFDLTPKIQTKFFLNKINQNANGIILKGIGSISLQKTTYLENTATVILDNSLVASKLENKTYTIPNSKNALTINKLGEKKVKLTLKGENLKDYRFIISPDGQNLFIANREFIINTDFSMTKSKIASYNVQKNSSNYYIFDFNFTNPVAYNVFEQNGNFYLDVDNLSDYNALAFAESFKKTDIKVEAIKISQDKTRFIIPMDNLNFAYANVESNAKSIKLCFREKNTAAIINPAPTNDTISVILPNKQEVQAPIPTIKVEKNIPNKGNVEVITKNDTKKIKKTSISSMTKVVIDPGHGGNDSGAIGGGIMEKHLNLEVAKLVKENLEKKNIYVYITRNKDVYLTLEERTNFSNELNPDIFVSIHTNSTLQENSYGLETHYYKDDSYELAKTIHKHFASSKNLNVWDTKDRGVIKSRFYVINHTEAPSVLIEIGFISNTIERNKLVTKKRQKEIADSITNGILEYLKVK